MKGLEKIIRDLLGDKFSDKEGESRQKYLARLTRAINKDMDEKDFDDKLSDKAKDWYNDKASVALEAQEEIPELPDADEEDVAERFPKKKAKKDKGAGDAKDEKKSKKSKKSKKEKGKKSKKEKKERKPREDSSGTKMRTYMLKNPRASKEDVSEAMTKKGVEISDATLGTMYYHCHATIMVAIELGIIKGKKSDDSEE